MIAFEDYIDYLLQNDRELLIALIDIGELHLDDYSIHDYLLDEKDVCPKCFHALLPITYEEHIVDNINEPFLIGYKCTNCAFKHIYT